MKVTFGAVTISGKSKRLIKKIVDSGRVTCGVYVRQLEKVFAKLAGAKEAAAVSSGGDANALAMAVMYDFGAGRGDEVIIPALSFVATGNSVLQAGFKPVFVDVRPDTLNIDPAKIEEAITKKTRAIIPVHLMGKPAEMDTINRIAKKHKLVVIEDAAEAYGTRYKGRPAGSLGDMACFSLYAAHVITAIEGGMVTTDNSKYAEIIRSLRSHGRACKCDKCVLNTASAYCARRFEYGTDIRFIFERVGYSSKMNELEAAVALGQLEQYGKVIKKRKDNLLYLMKNFRQFEDEFMILKEEKYEKIGPHAFPFVARKGSGIDRDRLVDYLEKKGIDTRSLFSSMPTQCAGFKFLGHRPGDFPNAEYIGNNGIHIGVHQELGRRELDYFIGCVKSFVYR